MKYKKKPIVIEAVQFTGNNYQEILDFGDKTVKQPFLFKDGTGSETIVIRTLEGNMEVSEGDYVIKGIKGEFYPCKPDIFEETYDKVED